MTEKNNVMNNKEALEVMVREEERFKVEKTPLIHTWAPGNYRQDLQRKRVKLRESSNKLFNSGETGYLCRKRL